MWWLCENNDEDAPGLFRMTLRLDLTILVAPGTFRITMRL
jgi:hypothetical protein